MWQAWHLRYLHRCPRKLGDDGGPMDADCLLRGRRGAFSTFGTFIDVRGSLATTVDPWTPTVFYVAGVTLSAPEARCVWQAWHFRYLHRCPRKLGDDGSAPEARFAWQAWRARYLHRCLRKLGDDGGPMDADCLLRGRRDTFSTAGAMCVWQAWHFRYRGPMDADCLRRGRRGTFST